LATREVAIDEDEAPVPRMTSTCSVSNQRPAMVAATSALFCTSACTISIFLPPIEPPKSSIAIWTAITAPIR
jgi:hypothetical protein